MSRRPRSLEDIERDIAVERARSRASFAREAALDLESAASRARSDAWASARFEAAYAATHGAQVRGAYEDAAERPGSWRLRARLAAHDGRAIRAGVRSSLTEEDWRAILESFDGRCVYCGEKGWVIDHLTPISRGGPNTIDNVVPACGPCNSRKRAHDVIDWLEIEGMPVAETLDRITTGHARAFLMGHVGPGWA